MISKEKLIVGCGNFGGVGSAPDLFGKGNTPEEAFELLAAARDLGLTRFDTANSYGGGVSEETLGRFLAAQGEAFRRNARVATKVGNPHGARAGRAPLAADEIGFQLERSLFRLGVERIDVYYVHELPQDFAVNEILEAFHLAILRGQIGSFGLSNVSLRDVQLFLEAAGPSLGRLLSHVQNEFHLLHAGDTEELIPFLHARGIRYSAFSPLAGGLLTGKYEPGSQAPAGSRLSLRPEPYARFRTKAAGIAIGRFVAGARDRGKSPASAALEYVLQTPGVSSAVIGPKHRRHLEDLGLV